MSLNSYSDYKNAGVEWLGLVPECWALGKLKNLLIIKGGQDYKLVETDDETAIPVIGSGGQFTYATDYLYDGESVLLGRKGTIDKPLYIHGKFWTVDTMFYSEMRGRASAKYAFYLATTIPFGFYSTSTALPSMSQFDLSNHQVAIPSIKEQTQIARFLDHEVGKIDALIAEQEKLIALLKEKRQAVISHAVTKGLNPDVPMKESGVEWLGQVPEHWKVGKLNVLIRTRKGFAFPSAEFVDVGVPVVKASDIKKFTINPSSTFVSENYLKIAKNAVLKANNIVLSTVGSTPEVRNSAVGQIARLPSSFEGALLNQNTVIFEPMTNELDEGYLFYCLCSHAYRDHLDLHAHGTANQASLSLEDMLAFVIPKPSLDEQIEIAVYINNFLADSDKLEAEYYSLVRLLSERRSALISAAVTGKIDVRGWQPPAAQ